MRTLLGTLFLCALVAPALADTNDWPADPNDDGSPICPIWEFSCSCGTLPCVPHVANKRKDDWYTGDQWINGAIDYGTRLGPIVQRMRKADKEGKSND